MSFVTGLRCRECGREYPKRLIAGCQECFAPLKVEYDYEAIGKILTREVIQSRDNSIWRYRELLPIDNDPKVGLSTATLPWSVRTALPAR